MKKLFSLVLALVLVVGMCSLNVFAEVDTSGFVKVVVGPEKEYPSLNPLNYAALDAEGNIRCVKPITKHILDFWLSVNKFEIIFNLAVKRCCLEPTPSEKHRRLPIEVALI